MMVDGVLQAMGVSGLLSTLAYRSVWDQLLFAAHIAVGAALLVAARMLFGDGANTRVAVGALLGALFVGLIETTWFNWLDVVMRSLYTVVALVIVLRKTTLPTT